MVCQLPLQLLIENITRFDQCDQRGTMRADLEFHVKEFIPHQKLNEEIELK